MAEYVPTTWECGDVVTAERLNHMEEGIEAANACCEGGSVLVVRATSFTIDGSTKAVETDTTWQEVADAIAEGTPCYAGFNLDDVYDASSLSDISVAMLPLAIAAYSNIDDGYYVRIIPYGSSVVLTAQATTNNLLYIVNNSNNV